MTISIPNIIEYELGGAGFYPIWIVVSVGVVLPLLLFPGSTGLVGLTGLRPQTKLLYGETHS